jgi:hypothetical protein
MGETPLRFLGNLRRCDRQDLPLVFGLVVLVTVAHQAAPTLSSQQDPQSIKGSVG